MFLSILIPHYNEPKEVVKPLLDSIEIQKNIDFNDIEVIICDDGPDAIELDREWLNSYSYVIKYYREEKGGVSKMRNLAFEHSCGEYVTWCDCDDMYASPIAFWFINQETKTPMQVMVNNVPTVVYGFDALYSAFLEEGRNPETKEPYVITRTDGFQFVHSKFFKADFIRRNDILFFEDCTIHEDHILNGKTQAMTQNIKWNPTPIYMWCWNDNSVCRRDPDYLLKTYVDMLKSSDHLVDWYKGKSKFDNARQTVVQMVYDAFYSFNCPRWKNINTKEYRDMTEKRFSDFYHKHKLLWDEAPDQLKMAISNGIRQRMVNEGMEMETETLKQFLERIENL